MLNSNFTLAIRESDMLASGYRNNETRSVSDISDEPPMDTPKIHRPSRASGGRAADQEVSRAGIVWTPPKVEKFYPAIIIPNASSEAVPRNPEWHVLRYLTGHEKLLFWMLDHIGLEYRYLFFLHRIKRRTSKKSYLPGYLFVEFDHTRDRWQQILRMPNVIEMLGGAKPHIIAQATLDDLVRKCPERLGRPTAFAAISPGTTVRILRGPLTGHTAVVIWSDRKTVKMPVILFGSRDVEVTLKASDVVVVE